MQTSYAVTWQEGAGPIRHGKLELRPRGLRLEGSDTQGPQMQDVAYEDLTDTHVTRDPSARLSGRPTLVVDRGSPVTFRIAGVAQPGIISELAENLAALRRTGERPHMSRLVIVVPLQPGARDRARALLAKGPPFDPEAAGLTRHHVFLTDDEAVFVFEADAQGAVERLASDETLWDALSGWSDLVAGPPRLADDVYSWVRPRSPGMMSFAPTPGPGDSEGGEVYAP
ncbi:MAG: hypothetical protein ABI896_07520 [Actinomycetota bacterium]